METTTTLGHVRDLLAGLGCPELQAFVEAIAASAPAPSAVPSAARGDTSCVDETPVKLTTAREVLGGGDGYYVLAVEVSPAPKRRTRVP